MNFSDMVKVTEPKPKKGHNPHHPFMTKQDKLNFGVSKITEFISTYHITYTLGRIQNDS